MKRGPAHAAGIGNGGDRRAELAGGEGIESAKAVGEFRGGQAALAVEPTEKILSEAVSFQRIALETTRDEVAVGIAPQLNAGDDVVEGHQASGKATQTVEAEATVARVDSHAQSPGFHKIGVLQAGSAAEGLGRVQRESPWANAPRPRDRIWCARLNAKRHSRRAGAPRCARDWWRDERHVRARQWRSGGVLYLRDGCGAGDENRPLGRWWRGAAAGRAGLPVVSRFVRRWVFWFSCLGPEES